MNVIEHIDNLTRHIDLVRYNCLLLGKRLIEKNEVQFGVQLIARGFKHDVSKFTGIEWDFLHNGPDVPDKELKYAIDVHQSGNDHHPEYWGGLEEMPRIAIAEMVCDWYARAQEFGTSLREWIDEKAVSKYNINRRGKQFKWIKEFVDILLQDSFKA
jgi:hypothetical protein